jgi:hypothetical protein
MAFGDIYGFKTNSRVVVAVAESDEYSGDGEDTLVDLILLGFDSGRRTGVPVAATEGDAPVNWAFPASS